MLKLTRKDLHLIFSILVFFFFIKGLGGSLWPFAIALIASYIALPWVQRLEAAGVPRIAGTAIFLFSFFLGCALIGAIIFPYLWSEGAQLVSDAPSLFESLLTRLQPYLSKVGVHGERLVPSFQYWLSHASQSVQERWATRVTTLIGASMGNIFNLLIIWLQILMAPVFFFFLLTDLEKLKSAVIEWIPEELRHDVLHFIRQSNKILGSYFRGQSLLAVTLATYYSLALWLVIGLPYGLLIGIVSGLLSFIPYVGFSLGLITSVAIGIGNGSWYWAVGSAVVYLGGQALDGLYLSPRLVGRSVGLPPLVSVLAAIIGANLLGFPGVLVGIPMVAITRELWLILREDE